MHEHERLSADIGKAIEHTEINQIIQTSKVPSDYSDYSDFQGSIRLFRLFRLPRFHQTIQTIQTSKVPLILVFGFGSFHTGRPKILSYYAFFFPGFSIGQAKSMPIRPAKKNS